MQTLDVLCVYPGRLMRLCHVQRSSLITVGWCLTSTKKHFCCVLSVLLVIKKYCCVFVACSIEGCESTTVHPVCPTSLSNQQTQSHTCTVSHLHSLTPAQSHTCLSMFCLNLLTVRFGTTVFCFIFIYSIYTVRPNEIKCVPFC